MTPMSLSIAAERAIERARAKLEQMDQQLASARSTISLVKKRSMEFQQADAAKRQSSATAINAAARQVLEPEEKGKKTSSSARAAELRKLRDELRHIRANMTQSRSLIQQALSQTPPRPMRPATPDIPEMRAIDESLGGGMNAGSSALVSFHPKQPALGRSSIARDRQLSIAGLPFCQPEVTTVGGIDRVRGKARQFQDYNAPRGQRRRTEQFDLNLFSIPIVQSEKRKPGSAGSAGNEDRRASRLVEEDSLFSPRPSQDRDAFVAGCGSKRVNVNTLKVRGAHAESSSSEERDSTSSDTSHETLYAPAQICYAQQRSPPSSGGQVHNRKPSVSLIKEPSLRDAAYREALVKEPPPTVINSLPLTTVRTPERNLEAARNITPSRIRPPSAQGYYTTLAKNPSPRGTAAAATTLVTPPGQSSLPRPASRLRNYTNGVTASLRAVPADDQAAASGISTPATSVLHLASSLPSQGFARQSAGPAVGASPFDRFRFNQSSTTQNTLPRSVSSPLDLKSAAMFPAPPNRPPHRTTPSIASRAAVTASTPSTLPMQKPRSAVAVERRPMLAHDDPPSPTTTAAPLLKQPAVSAIPPPTRGIVKSATDGMLYQKLATKQADTLAEEEAGSRHSASSLQLPTKYANLARLHPLYARHPHPQQLHADAVPALLGRLEEVIARLTVRLAAEEALETDSESERLGDAAESDEDGSDNDPASALGGGAEDTAAAREGRARLRRTQSSKSGGNGTGREMALVRRSLSSTSHRSTQSSALAESSRRKLEAALHILEEAVGET